MRNNLKAALELAGLDWKLVPLHAPKGDRCDCNRPNCPSVAKHPRVTDWTRAASDELETVMNWWQQWPHANIGIATGPASGIVVLDVDVRHGGDEEIERLVKQHGLLPRCPAAATGGGGSHYYFKHPGGTVLSRTILPGIDVKGDGGQVVAAPSVHASGTSYEWYEGLSPWEAWPPPEVPGWLLVLMKRDDDGRTFREAEPLPARITAGGRNQWLTSIGGTMRRRGVHQESIFAALMEENTIVCDPPLARTEVAQIAASVSRYEPGEAILIVDTEAPPEPDKRGPYVPQPFSARELLELELPEVKWAVSELLPEGLAVLAGKPKMGKSWMAFHLGIAIAEGGVALNWISVEDGDVLVLALEDNKRRLKKRLGMLLKGEDAPGRLHFETAWPREDEGGPEALDAWLGQHPDSRLVVVDTLAKFRRKGGDPKYQDDYGSIEKLQMLAGKHGVCILLIHHLRKALADDWVDTISGTLGIAGAADTLLGLDGKRGEDEAVLHLTGRDIEDDRDLALKRDRETGLWAIVGLADDVKVGKETQLLTAVMGEIGHPVTPAELAPHLGKTRAATKMLLYRASKTGHILSFGNGQYSLPVTPVTNGDVTHIGANGGELEPGGKGVGRGAQIQSDNEMLPRYHVTGVTTLPAEGPGNTVTPLSSPLENGPGLGPTGVREWAVALGAPENPCRDCGEVAWSRRIGNRWLCSNCQPYIVPIRPEGSV